MQEGVSSFFFDLSKSSIVVKLGLRLNRHHATSLGFRVGEDSADRDKAIALLHLDRVGFVVLVNGHGPGAQHLALSVRRVDALFLLDVLRRGNTARAQWKRVVERRVDQITWALDRLGRLDLNELFLTRAVRDCGNGCELQALIFASSFNVLAASSENLVANLEVPDELLGGGVVLLVLEHSHGAHAMEAVAARRRIAACETGLVSQPLSATVCGEDEIDSAG
mmetsp:Transcript_5678/g.13185  ORF Transcript_5678/g.13185 Transcript_5678/m.13185 type:complete len:223 (+) Transcript_5678:230-898(+)